MIAYFNKTLELIMPRNDNNGEPIKSTVIDDSIQSLLGLTERCSITETVEYSDEIGTAIRYKFQYTPISDRRDNNDMVYSVYTFIATLLLYNELEFVNVNIGENAHKFEVDDLGKLQFTLDKLLFDKVEGA